MTTIFYCCIFIIHIYFLVICTACRAQTKTATLLELMQVTQYKTAVAATKSDKHSAQNNGVIRPVILCLYWPFLDLHYAFSFLKALCALAAQFQKP